MLSCFSNKTKEEPRFSGVPLPKIYHKYMEWDLLHVFMRPQIRGKQSLSVI